METTAGLAVSEPGELFFGEVEGLAFEGVTIDAVDISGRRRL